MILRRERLRNAICTFLWVNIPSNDELWLSLKVVLLLFLWTKNNFTPMKIKVLRYEIHLLIESKWSLKFNKKKNSKWESYLNRMHSESFRKTMTLRIGWKKFRRTISDLDIISRPRFPWEQIVFDFHVIYTCARV